MAIRILTDSWTSFHPRRLPPFFSFVSVVAGQDKSRIAILCGSQFAGSHSDPRRRWGWGEFRRTAAPSSGALPQLHPPPAERTDGLGARRCARLPSLSPRQPYLPQMSSHSTFKRTENYICRRWTPSKKTAGFIAWILRKKEEEKALVQGIEVLSSAAVHGR